MGFKNAYPAGSAPGTGSGGAGFWTGAGLGALGGYLFGRNTGGSSGIFGSSRGTRPTNERFMRDSGFDDHDADQPSTSFMRESTGWLWWHKTPIELLETDVSFVISSGLYIILYLSSSASSATLGSLFLRFLDLPAAEKRIGELVTKMKVYCLAQYSAGSAVRDFCYHSVF
ncbi:hypothetical protein GCK32_016853 [Trichostrongylus colubriformis]|uniref:Uncharacterized protein n=1 Tax=Trichostrongylus colubriformis TaxID=6319 RepID=A0AAN8ITE9_TRICO